MQNFWRVNLEILADASKMKPAAVGWIDLIIGVIEWLTMSIIIDKWLMSAEQMISSTRMDVVDLVFTEFSYNKKN